MTPALGYPGRKLDARRPFLCFMQGMAGMSRDLGRDVPGSEKLYARKLSADFSFRILNSLGGLGAAEACPKCTK